jgi:prepilin-type N-terminal cleavage/methylation domain-containing protein
LEIIMKKQSGFTLIELLLVLAIIGIISAIAIPALLGQRERAKAKSVQANLDSVASECARLNDTLKEQGQAQSATVIVTSVLAMSNFCLPNAKDPYDGSSCAYIGGALTGVTGQVGLSGGTVVDATGLSYQAVTIQANYLVGGAAASLKKVVALD